MNKSLVNDIGQIIENGGDFAYFCRFQDEKRIAGDEFLFETDEKPLNFTSNLREALDISIPEILRSLPDGIDKVPLFLSYDFIFEVFGIEGKLKSKWPMIAAISPSRMRTGKFNRSDSVMSNFMNNRASMANSVRERLEESIGDTVERIRNGELLQTVLSNRFNILPFDGQELLKYLLKNDRSRYVFYYKFGGREIVGSSPENVFVRQGSQVSISPIAGTRNRLAGNESDLISSLRGDSKEQCEHRMLVDLARNDLARISLPGSVKVTKDMNAEQFYSVIHLTSNVTGHLRPDVTNYDVFSSIFPAGTVSGAPKRRAIEIIDGAETSPRGAYSGSIGMIGDDEADMALTIRSAFKGYGESYVQAGAGIVKDSVPSKEVDEMIAKANTVMSGGLSCI